MRSYCQTQAVVGLEVTFRYTSSRLAWLTKKRTYRDEFFDLICSGVPLSVAAARLGVSGASVANWWRDAGAMKLKKAYRGGGLARPGAVDAPGGPGRHLKLDKRNRNGQEL